MNGAASSAEESRLDEVVVQLHDLLQSTMLVRVGIVVPPSADWRRCCRLVGGLGWPSSALTPGVRRSASISEGSSSRCRHVPESARRPSHSSGSDEPDRPGAGCPALAD